MCKACVTRLMLVHGAPSVQMLGLAQPPSMDVGETDEDLMALFG